jgi:hypothetical protein
MVTTTLTLVMLQLTTAAYRTACRCLHRQAVTSTVNSSSLCCCRLCRRYLQLPMLLLPVMTTCTHHQQKRSQALNLQQLSQAIQQRPQ